MSLPIQIGGVEAQDFVGALRSCGLSKQPGEPVKRGDGANDQCDRYRCDNDQGYFSHD